MQKEEKMASKTDFTPSEWSTLMKAPGWASLAVVAASPSGPFGVVKELFAAGKILADAKASTPNPLVGALVADLGTSEGRQQAHLQETSGKSPDELRTLAVEQLKQVASLVNAKAGADAAGFKRWLATLSESVAQAATEGGFLGFGGTRVSDKEQSALADIRTTLGVTA
jgi:hypothetical protein